MRVNNGKAFRFALAFAVLVATAFLAFTAAGESSSSPPTSASATTVEIYGGRPVSGRRARAEGEIEDDYREREGRARETQPTL